MGTVRGLREPVADALQGTERMVDIIQGTEKAILDIASITAENAAAAEVMARESDRVSDEISSVTAAAEEQTASTDELHRHSQNLSSLAQHLNDLVMTFKTADNAGDANDAGPANERRAA